MRGKVSVKLDALATAGITPAYAGKRLLRDLTIATFQDHPRLCGEKSRYSVTLWITAGSPPPMRGKVCGKKANCSYSGITPAYAGKR